MFRPEHTRDKTAHVANTGRLLWGPQCLWHRDSDRGPPKLRSSGVHTLPMWFGELERQRLFRGGAVTCPGAEPGLSRGFQQEHIVVNGFGSQGHVLP